MVYSEPNPIIKAPSVIVNGLSGIPKIYINPKDHPITRITGIIGIKDLTSLLYITIRPTNTKSVPTIGSVSLFFVMESTTLRLLTGAPVITTSKSSG